MPFDYDSNSWRVNGAPSSYWTETTTIKIPARFKTIIERTISVLEKSGTPPITNFANKNLNKLKYLLDKIENKYDSIYIEPSAIYRGRYDQNYNYEFQLTREDFNIILKYTFVIDRETLITVLNQLGIKTKNHYKINPTCVYKWKILTQEEWKNRYQKLMREKWKWDGNQFKKGEIKQKIVHSIKSGKYNKELKEIREQIEANHQKVADYVLIHQLDD